MAPDSAFHRSLSKPSRRKKLALLGSGIDRLPELAHGRLLYLKTRAQLLHRGRIVDSEE
jgi:hypothetical protein